VLVGGARLPAAQALPRALRTLCERPAHPLRPGSFQADLDGLATDVVRLRERLVHPVSVIDRSSNLQGTKRWWRVLVQMRSMHQVVFELRGIYPATLRLTVDDRVVWEAKRNFRRFPTVDVPFRIESENADGWLVLQDRSNAVVLRFTAAVWVESRKVMWIDF
jgi:hypothetical protein